MDSSQPEYTAYSFQENHGTVLQLASGNAGPGEGLITTYGADDHETKYESSKSDNENSTTKNLQRLEERRIQRQMRRPRSVLDGTWFAGFRDGHWQYDRCEERTERYREYRMNQKKKYAPGRPQKEQQVWPDDKEELFQYGEIRSF